MAGGAAQANGESSESRLIAAAYSSFFGVAPEPEHAAVHLSALRQGVPWEEFLRTLVHSESFRGIQPGGSEDPFQEIERLRPLLAALKADVTIPLHPDHTGRRPLHLRGPVRDITIFWNLIQNRGVWQPELTALLMGLLRPQDTFVDVGANLGYFTVLAAERVASSSEHPAAGRVVAFEPLASHAEYCRRNVELNRLHNVQVLPYALWNETAAMRMAPDGGELHQMGGAHLVGGVTSTPAESNAESVSCVTLDGLVDQGELDLSGCSVIKMDIEGAEPYALQGMSKTVERTRPLLVVELNRQSLEKFGKTIGSMWQALAELHYEVAVIPAAHQAKLVDSLAREKLSLSRYGGRAESAGSVLRKLHSLDQTEHIVERLEKERPPADPVDLLAVPAERP